MIADTAEGMSYDDLPLHITLMHWFQSSTNESVIVNALEKVVFEPVVVEADSEDMYGKNHDIRVTKIKRTTNLQNLHLQLYEKFNSLDVVYSEKEFVGDGYGPHSTHKPNAKLEKGDQITIDSFWLVSSEEESRSPRKMIKKFIANA